MTKKRLLSLCVLLMLFAFTGSAFATTWYVDAQYGLNTYDGEHPRPNEPAAGNGPKLTVSNAIVAAQDGDVIIIAPRGTANKYNIEPGNLITANKSLTFKILADPTTGYSGTPNTGNVCFDADLTVNDVGAAPIAGLALDVNGTSYKFQMQPIRDVTITQGSITGAGSMVFDAAHPTISTVTRNDKDYGVDAAPTYNNAKSINLVYGDDDITVGNEWTGISAIFNVIWNPTGAKKLTLGADRHMEGFLTFDEGEIVLGANTLTLEADVDRIHNMNFFGGGNGKITSSAIGVGLLKFAGAKAHTVNNGTELPNIEAASTGAGGTGLVTLTNITDIKGNVAVSNKGDLQFKAAVTVTGGAFVFSRGDLTFDLATQINGNVSNSYKGNAAFTTSADINGNVVNSGEGTFNVGTTHDIEGDVTNSHTGNMTFTGNGDILGNLSNTSTAVVTFNGTAAIHKDVTNSGAVANASNKGNIAFNAAATINGNVVNSKNVSNDKTTPVGGTTYAGSGNITFADAAHTIDKNLDNDAVVSISEISLNQLNTSGRITFANTANNVVVKGRVRNNTNVSFTHAAHTLTNDADIIWTARAGGTITVGLVAANANVENNSTGTRGGLLDFGSAGAETGAVTVNGNVEARGTGSGETKLIANTANLTVTGNVDLDPTSGSRKITTAGNGTVTVNGNVVRGASGSGDINFASTGAYDIDGVVQNEATTAGAHIDFANAVVVIDGAVKNTGKGSITFASNAPPWNVTLGGLELSDGTVDLQGAGVSTAVIDVDGNYLHTGGTLDLGTGVRDMKVSGTANEIASSAVYKDGFSTTLIFDGTAAQDLNMSSGGTMHWPGHLNVNNTFAVGTDAFTLRGGNLFVDKNATFTDGQVVINGVYLFIGRNFNYNNATTEAYKTNTVGVQEGFISMQNKGAVNVINATTGIAFANFEIDNANGADFAAGKTYDMTQIFALTNGVVSETGADATLDFDNVTTFPEIRRNAGSFNAALGNTITFTSGVDVVYISSADVVMGLEIPAAAGKLNDLSVNLVGGATKVTSSGNFDVNGQLSVKNGKKLDLQHTLTMGNGAAALVGRTTPSKIILNGNADIISGGGAPKITFNDHDGGTAIEGTGSTAANGNEIVADVTVNTLSTGNTIAGIRKITGDFTVNGTGTITSLAFVNQATITDYNNIVGDMTFAGGATGGITLGSRVQIGTHIVLNAGTLALGAYDFVIENEAASAHVLNGTNVTISSTGGYLVFEGVSGADLTLAGADMSVPYVKLNLDNKAHELTLKTNDLVVTNTLDATKGIFTDNGGGEYIRVTGNKVNFSSNASLVGAALKALGLELKPTTGTLTATFHGPDAFEVTNLDIEGDVTLAGAAPGLKVGAQAAGEFKHVSGALNFGTRKVTIGDGVLASNFTRTAGTYSGTGYLVWNSTGIFTNGDGMEIPNFEIQKNCDLATNKDFTVKDNLHLNNAILDHTQTGTTKLLIFGVASGTRPTLTVTSAGNLDIAPKSFAQGTMDVVFKGNALGISAIYWPTAPSTLVNSVELNMGAAANAVTLGALNRTINGITSLKLTKGDLQIDAAGSLTLASGLTITRTNNGTLTDAVGVGCGGTLVAPNVNLVYTGGAIGNTGPEYELPTVVTNVTLNAGATLTFFTARTAVGLVTLNGVATLGGNTTFKDVLIGTAGALIVNTKILTLTGNFEAVGNGNLNIGIDDGLVFAGPVDQTFKLNKNIVVKTLTMNQTADKKVTVSGGNINVGNFWWGAAADLNLTRGILEIASGKHLYMTNADGAQQGYIRDGSSPSHIVGDIRVKVDQFDQGRWEFPVGALNGKYRPAAITFQAAHPAVTTTEITLRNVDANPGGTVGLPIIEAGSKIGSTSPYYWMIGSSPSLGTSQIYDVELKGTNLNKPFDSVNDLRIVRRYDGDVTKNKWEMIGSAASYAGNNILETPTPGDTVITVRVSSAAGAIVAQNARYAIGVPPQDPTFTAVLGATTVAEGDSVEFTYQATDPDVGVDPPTYSLINPPANATIDETTGAFKFKPDYTQAGDHTIKVRATKSTDATSYVETSAVINVTNVNRPPVFTSVLDDLTVAEGTLVSHTYTATDADAQDLTFAIVAAPAGAAIGGETGEFSYTPATGLIVPRVDIVVVSVTDAIATVNDTAFVTVILPAGPVFTDVMPSAKIKKNETVAYTYAATDPNADPVTFSVIAGPGTIGETSGDFNWTPTTDADAGVHEIIVGATDGTFVTKDTAIVTVLLWGDVDINYVVQAYDASLVLQHKVGLITLTGDPLELADVSGDAVVSAYDAAFILQYSVGLITEFPVESGSPKAIVSYGKLNWTKPTAIENSEMMLLPISLSADASNVYSVEFTVNIDPTLVEIDEVKSQLPEDWIMVSNAADGKLSVAMAGLTPLSGGEIATVTLRMLDEKAGTVITGEASVNENRSQALEQLEIRQVPTEFALDHNYPNPFNPATNIRFQLAKDGKVSITVYNILGNKVRTLVNENKTAGYYTVQWNGMNDAGHILPSGTYIYQINAGSFTATKKMLLMK